MKNKIKKINFYAGAFVRVVKKDGLKTALNKIKYRLLKIEENPKKEYISYYSKRKNDLNKVNSEIVKQLDYQPHISIILFSDSNDLINSLKEQIYQNFELILIGDKELSEDKLKIVYSENKNTRSETLELALTKAWGDYILILDENIILFKDTLLKLVQKLNEDESIDLIYSDEDYLDDKGKHYKGFFKPDFSYDTLTSIMYLDHALYRNEFLKGIQFDNKISNLKCIEWNIAMQIYERSGKISHISEVLFTNISENSDLEDLTQQGIHLMNNHINRCGIKGIIEKGIFPGSLHLKREIEDKSKLVSIIIPTKDNIDVLDVCIKSIESKSTYRNFEIIIINNNSEKEESFDYFKNTPHKVLDLPIPFNFSVLNNRGFEYAKGDYVLFLNNDTEVLVDNWLESFIELAQRKEVGMVGPKLLYPDNTVQHAGLVLGIVNSVAGHGMKYISSTDHGYFGFADIVREVGGVTGAAIFMRSDVFREIDIFDEEYGIVFQDVDLCMKVRKKGYKIIYTPFAQLYHYESKTRSKVPGPREFADGGRFVAKWGYLGPGSDPFYNKNLTFKREDYSYN